MHDNVVTLIGVVESEGPLVIVTPYFEFGSLKDYLQECGHILEADTLKRFCLDVAHGVAYLAGMRLVHRDIAVREKS